MVTCRTCGYWHQQAACPQCGAKAPPATYPSITDLPVLLWVPGLMVVAVILYLGTPAGESDLPLLLLIIVGIPAAALLARWAYKAWYRRHYGR